MKLICLLTLSFLIAASTFAIEPIEGDLLICAFKTTSLTNATPGGKWTSGNKAVASINNSGVATGVAGGTSVITYTKGKEFATVVLTVNPIPAPIIAPVSLSAGSTATLSDATPGGTWSNKGGVYVDISATGVVYAIAPGMEAVLYTLPTGCLTISVIGVTDPPPPTDTFLVPADPRSLDITNLAKIADELTLVTDQGRFTSLIVTNSMAQTMIKQEVTPPYTTVSLKDLKPGLYYITLRGDRGSKPLKFTKK